MTRARKSEVVYLIHFDRPIGDITKPTGYAQHYMGSTPDLAARLVAHAKGQGAKIMAAVAKAGINWHVARTWPGGRQRERQLKRQGGAAPLCPSCNYRPRNRRGASTSPR
jgi:hypothetical protein